MSIPAELKDRYLLEHLEPFARGGMGEVYRAYDKVMETDVAIKVLFDMGGATELFEREWKTLRELQHGNIVRINDRGEFKQGSQTRRYFVMPFLRGKTLYELIRDPQHRLTPEQVVEIICAVCSGLSAAHSQNVIHRDIKPSNIFVLEAGSVQIIDFGIAHFTDSNTFTTIKGTTSYIAPELFNFESPAQPSSRSDIYSLGVVCYEALTGVQPFERESAEATVQAILRCRVAPASERNPEVNLSLSRVVQKAMARIDAHRYATAAEFGEKLKRALRNEALPEFDSSKIEPRMRVVREEYQKGNLTTANRVLSGLEAEGHVDPSISLFRTQIDQALRQQRANSLLNSARFDREAKQYLEALNTLDKLLAEEPDNLEAASQKNQTEAEWVQDLRDDVRRHLERREYAEARKILEKASELRPRDTENTQLGLHIQRLEEQQQKLRDQQERLYQQAQESYGDGNIGTALEKLEKLVALQNQSMAAISERETLYKNFHDHVLQEQERIRQSHEECQEHLAAGKLSQALAICEQMLSTYPSQPLFSGTKLEIENRERQIRLDYVREVCQRVESVADLEMRVSILQETVSRYPAESQLQELLRNAKSKRDLIGTLVAYARKNEDRGEFSEALEKWYMIRHFHPGFPNLEAEMDRIQRRRANQVATEKKERLIEQIELLLRDSDHSQAKRECDQALEEFGEDAELTKFKQLAEEGLEHAAEAERLLARGQELIATHLDEALSVLRRANELDSHRESIRQLLGTALVEKAKKLYSVDWVTAENLIKEALLASPYNPEAKNLATVIADVKQAEYVQRILARSRELDFHNSTPAAFDVLEEALRSYPNDRRLLTERDKLAERLGYQKTVLDSALPGKPRTPQPVEEAITPASATSLVNDSGTSEKPEPSRIPRVPPQSSTVPRNNEPSPAWWHSFSPRSMTWVGLGVFVAVLIAAIAIKGIGPNPGPKPRPVPEIPVKISAEPPASEIQVDGKVVTNGGSPVPLAAGGHSVRVSLPGYKVVEQNITVSSPMAPLSYHLQPLSPALPPPSTLPLALSLQWKDSSFTAALDDKPLTVQNGAVQQEVQPGSHTLKLATERSEGEIHFDFASGSAPAISSLTSPQQAAVFVISTDGTKGSIRCTCGQAKATVDGTTTIDLTQPETPVELAEGTHQFEITGQTNGTFAATVASKTPVLMALVLSRKLSEPVFFSRLNKMWDEGQFQDGLQVAERAAKEYPESKRIQAQRQRFQKALGK